MNDEKIVIDHELIINEDTTDDIPEAEIVLSEEEQNNLKNLLEETEKFSEGGEDIIEKAFEQLDVSDVEGIDKEDIKSLFFGETSMENIVDKIYDNLVKKIFDQYPDILHAIFTDKNPEDKYHPVVINYNGVRYYIKDEFLKEEYSFNSNDGETKKLVFKIFNSEAISKKIREFKKDDVEYLKAVDSIMELLFTKSATARKEFLGENLLKANVDAINEFLKVDKVVEHISIVNVAKCKEVLGFYTKRLAKKLKSLGMKDDFAQDLNLKLRMFCFTLSEHEYEVLNLAKAILKNIIDVVNDKNTHLLITLSYYFVTSARMHLEEKPTEEEIKLLDNSGLNEFAITIYNILCEKIAQ